VEAHARAVENVRGLPTRRDVFIDERGAGLRVTWHPEQDVVVLSVWHEDRCAGTFRMPVQDVPRLSGLLAAALGDWVTELQVSAAPQPGPGEVARGLGSRSSSLSVVRRLRLSPALLRLRQRRAGGISAR
jgi:hypothetical protein